MTIGVVGVKISQLITAPQALDGSEWVPIDQNGGTYKVASSNFASNIVTELLTIVIDDVIPSLEFNPNGKLLQLVWNHQTFLAVGSPADFSYLGHTLTWLNSTYTLAAGSVVAVTYTY